MGTGSYLVRYMREHPSRLAEAKAEGQQYWRSNRPVEFYAQRRAAARKHSERRAAERSAIDWELVAELRRYGLSWARVAFVLRRAKTRIYFWGKRAGIR